MSGAAGAGILGHAYLLKGWLLDKDPPKAVTEAVDAIIAGVNSDIAQDVTAIKLIDTQITGLRGEAEQIASRLAKPKHPPSPPDATEAAFSAADDPAPAKKQRKSPDLTDEQKAAIGARLKAARESKAAKAAEQPSGETERAEPVASASATPYTPASAEKLIEHHNGYAGKRDPGQPLTDEDWADIKARLAKHHDRFAIASDYDQDPEDLDHFIASCQRREARSSGEAPASPSVVASDAARRTL